MSEVTRLADWLEHRQNVMLADRCAADLLRKQDTVLKQALDALQWEHGGEPLPTLTAAAIAAIKEVLK